MNQKKEEQANKEKITAICESKNRKKNTSNQINISIYFPMCVVIILQHAQLLALLSI